MERSHKKLTVTRLRELLDYTPHSGVFTWRVTRGGNKCGSVAGSDDGKGYLLIRIDGANYKAHQLAWLYVHGTWPETELDHVDRAKSNNRIANLRKVTRSQNSQNKTEQRNNTSGYRGVSWHKRDRKWIAKIMLNGKRKHIGQFNSAIEASEAYLLAEAKLHSHRPVT